MKATPQHKKAIIYARVSFRDKEREGYSIPSQLSLLRGYASTAGFTITKEFIDIETAKQPGRKAFSEMIELFKEDPTCRILLVEKTGRLFRNFPDFITLEALNVEVHFVKEGSIYSSESRSSDKLIQGIRLVLAKNYIDNLREETQHKTYEACVRDKSQEQTEAIYGDIAKVIVERAVETGKPIAHEELDFEKKKMTLKEQGVGYARMLSGLGYARFLMLLDRRAYKEGVCVYSENPAYTSVIGKVKFMSRYGLTPHESAGLVIARRVQEYSEWPSSTGDAFSVPGRNRGKHAWSYWKKVKESGVCNQHHVLYGRFQQDTTGQAKSLEVRSEEGLIHADTYLYTSTGKALSEIPRKEVGGLWTQGESP